MYFDVTRHVCNVSCCEGDQFQLWHTHERECIHRCDVRLTSTEPVLCRQILHECPSSLSQSRCRDPSHLGRCGSFCSSSYSPFFVFFFRFVLQFYRVVAHWRDEVLALYRSRQLCEFALAVDHLQVLNVVPDVGGALQREGVVRVWIRRRRGRRRNHFWVIVYSSFLNAYRIISLVFEIWPYTTFLLLYLIKSADFCIYICAFWSQHVANKLAQEPQKTGNVKDRSINTCWEHPTR